MSPNKKQIAADCFKKGTEAMNKENWDYAIAMVGKGVALVPENLLYRQTLRGCESRKYGNNGSGARMAGMKLMRFRTQIKKAKLKQDWRAIDRAAEEGLKTNPWDPQLNADMAQACHELGFDEVAIFGYQKAVEGDTDNIDYNRRLALLLEERGSYADAIKHWQRIQKLNPLDGEARSKITHLDAKEVMDHGGYDEAESTRDVKEEIQSAYDLDRPVKKVLPDAVDGPGISVEADLQRAIRKEPANKDNYLKLADYYKRQKELDEAAEMLRQALEVSGGDPNVREQLEDVELLQLKHKLDAARQAAAKNPDKEKLKKKAVDLRREFAQREIEVFSSRVERYPKDSSLKYELARRYMLFKKWSQAIPLLQQSIADQRLKCEVGVSLGECFMADKKKNLAQRQFERAVEGIDPYEKSDLFKKAHYYLAMLCQESGRRDQAEHHYHEILGVDYEYRDVLKRLEKLQSGGAKNSGDGE